MMQLQEASAVRDEELQRLDILESEADQRFLMFTHWYLYFSITVLLSVLL